MNKKIALLGALVLIALGALAVVLYKGEITNPPKSVTQNPAPSPALKFSVIDEKVFSSSNAVEHYRVGSVEFVLYPWVDATNKPGYFEVHENNRNVFSSQPNYQVGSILSFALGDNTYVVVKDYSGGAHCCDTDYLFRINPAGQVKLLKVLDMGNATISKSSLVVKNNKLYIALIDDRFQYFHVAFAYSYFFTQYYQLDGDELTMANGDFSDVIEKTAQDCKAKITSDPVQPDNDGNYWLNDVICYVANYSLIGKQDVALRDFNGFFNKFFPSGVGQDAFDQMIKPDALKKEIVDTINNDRFK